MSVKSFGATHGGPYFRFKATEEQLSKFLFRSPIFERSIDKTILPIGNSVHMPSGAVLVKRAEGEFNLYGHSPSLIPYPDENDNINKIPLDLADEIDYIIDSNLFTTWGFIYD